ncbi:MAG TPA: GNAT family N-acetyltransferase [Terriglobales bacterium]
MDSPRTDLSFAIATARDVPALLKLHAAVAGDLTGRYGPGPWSLPATYNEKPMLYDVSRSKFVRILIARDRRGIAATLRLQTKKPWAIDTAYFSPVERPLYLTSMAVLPKLQRRGVGRRLLQEAEGAARAWPADAIRLDAFAGAAGAGPFYAKCAYREVGRVTYRKSPLMYFELVFGRSPGV